MNVGISQRSFWINLDDTFCFYFCNHFLKAFKEKVKIKDALVLRKSNPDEVIACSDECKGRIVKYLRHFDTLSDEFFLEASKLLIQYFPVNYNRPFFVDLTLNDACI